MHALRGIERTGTLRIVRFGDGYQIDDDAGTLIGFLSIVARTGEIPATHPEQHDEKSLLEVMGKVEGAAKK